MALAKAKAPQELLTDAMERMTLEAFEGAYVKDHHACGTFGCAPMPDPNRPNGGYVASFKAEFKAAIAAAMAAGADVVGATNRLKELESQEKTWNEKYYVDEGGGLTPNDA